MPCCSGRRSTAAALLIAVAGLTAGCSSTPATRPASTAAAPTTGPSTTAAPPTTGPPTTGPSTTAGPPTTAAPAMTETMTMVDLAYQPDDPITVAQGTTVRFVLHNAGRVAHEAFIGDQAAQDAHEQAMLAPGMSGMQMAGPDEVDVPPGQTATLSYTFAEPGSFVIGCHYPGHYTAGMHRAISVVAPAT